LEKVRVAASKIYSDLEQKKITHEEASRDDVPGRGVAG